MKAVFPSFFLGLLLAVFCGAGCGSVTWFVSFNTGQVDDALQNGFVLVIGTPHSQPLQAVKLIEGEIPPGMEVQDNGTVEGIPETSGDFDFTLELTETSGKVLQKSYSVEVEAPSHPN